MARFFCKNNSLNPLTIFEISSGPLHKYAKAKKAQILDS